MRLPLTLCLRPSPTLITSMIVGHGVAAAVLLPLTVPLWATVVGVLGLFLSALLAIRRLRSNLPVLVLGADGVARIESGRGEFTDARVAADTVVLPWLVVIALEVGGRRRLLPVAADSLRCDEFRDLRLWLRWRPGGRQALDA